VLGTRAALRTGRAQLRTEHHVMHFDDLSSGAFTRWAAKRTDRFVAVSDYVRKALSKRVPDFAPRTFTVRNGVDTEHFAPRPRGERGERLRLAIVCRLTGWKRVDRAIEATASEDVELVVVGDGEDRKKLEAYARDRRANVEFVGFAPDPRPHVAGCDGTLSTSKEEPLGLSVLESLAMSRPVVAYPTGGIPEIVVDGETGFLAKDDSVEGIVEAVRRAKSAHAEGRLGAMGEAGRAFASAHGSIDAMCAGYATQYRTLVGKT
jgi:L-malate glycosyltransferase